ncbi:hypothetical protein AI27_05135 [Sphingomonas sp. BHC-A]|nr:hypothetical protein AI27_05135 [Sphingomonas sp. BHC-A]
MADQRIASGPRLSPLPVPQQRVSMLEGASDLIEAAQGIERLRNETDQRIAASEARIEERRQQEADAALSASQGAAFAAMQSRITLETEKLRSQGVEGFEGKVQELVDRGIAQFDAGFGNNQRVRQRFMPNMADLAGRAATSAGLWAIGERAKLHAVQIEGTGEELDNGLRQTPGINSYVAAITTVDAALAGQGLSPSGLAAARKDSIAKRTDALIDGFLATGQTAQAKALLDAGFFNDKLPDVDRVRSRIVNAEEAAARQVELAQSRARTAANDAADLLQKKVAAGIVPTSAEIASVRQQATAAGVKPDDLFDIALLEQKVAINRTYQGQDVTVLLHDRDALTAKMVAGKASEGEQVTVKQLNDLIETREKETAARYKGLLGQGAAGRAQIVNELQRLPADARFSQAERIESGLGFVVGLPTADARAAAINGRQERKANPKLAPAADVDANFRTAMGSATMGMQGSTLNGIRDLAADLYAHAHRAAGGGDEFNPGLYRNSLNIALGRTRRGDGTPQGGIGTYGGRQVILPDSKTQDEFASDIARAPYDGATYDGNTPFQKADLGRRYFPVYLGENEKGQARYRIVSTGGHELQRKGGGAFVLVIAR